jgi:hypothetical protein
LGELESAIEEALNAEPSPYDSHPAPRDRIRWVEALAVAHAGAEEDLARDGWWLFDDREHLELEMTHYVRTNVYEAHGIMIPSEAAEEARADKRSGRPADSGP